MERIQNILQRLQELYYSKHAKSAIDLDLMLDYTRVLYADLLEWKKNVPAVAEEVVTAPHKAAEPQKEETQDSTAIAEDNKTEEPTDNAADTNEDSDKEDTATTREDEENVAKNEPSQERETTEAERESSVEEEPEIVSQDSKPAQKEQAVETPIAAHANEAETIEEKKEHKEIKREDIYSDIVDEFPEQESLNAIKDGNGISFEAPSEATSISYTEDVTAVEEPVANAPVEVYELPVMPVNEETPKPQQDLFTTVSNDSKKDIRAGIGINDKYLFLNELFNNHKTEYEEALDRLNRFNGYEEAYNWVIANTAVYNKWEEDDETVQNFFAVLKKHFSASK